MRRFWWIALVALAASCGPKKPVEPPKPKVGWHPVKVETEEGAQVVGECYYPPNFEELNDADRRMARQDTLEAMMSQWRGEHDEIVEFGQRPVTDLETVLLGRPELIEMVATINLQKCNEAMKSGDTSGWSQWLRELPGKLTEGECKTPPLYYTLFDYLDVAKGWQIPAYVCAGDRVEIKASSIDKYRYEEGGPWVNAAGNTELRATDPAYPCNMEGCYVGQLVMRYTSEDGAIMVVPVGLSTVFEAPGHGKIEVMINDTELYDNRYMKEGAVIHHTSIEYSPAE